MSTFVRLLDVVIFLCWITNSIDCDGNDPCECTNSGSCTLSCIDIDQICKGYDLICKEDEICDIHCDSGSGNSQACDSAEIDASTATNVTLRCQYDQDCKSLEIQCGTGTNKHICVYY